MRKTLFVGCAAFALAGVVWEAQVSIADAQSVSMEVAQAGPGRASGALMAPADAGRDRPELRPGVDGLPPGMREGWQRRWRMEMMLRTWGLFAPVRDKKLTPDDVKILAQAMLLRHGNHDWTVTDVAPTPSGSAIGFTFAAGDGKSPIAKFEMDRQTGRVHRVG
jgi:hypothetical protein